MIPNILTSNKWASEPGEVSSDALGFKKFMWMQDGFLRFQSKITSWSSDSIVTHYSTFDSEVLWVRWQYSKTGYVSLTRHHRQGFFLPFTFSVTHCLLISSLYQFVKQSTQWIFCLCFTQFKKRTLRISNVDRRNWRSMSRLQNGWRKNQPFSNESVSKL